jgi:hypothetical protein
MTRVNVEFVFSLISIYCILNYLLWGFNVVSVQCWPVA